MTSIAQGPKQLPVSLEEGVELVEDEKLFIASQSQLIWWRFRKHRLALISTIFIIMMYLIALFAEFVAPYEPSDFFVKYKNIQPTTIYIIDPQTKALQWPTVYGTVRTVDPNTFASVYAQDLTKPFKVILFMHGSSYKPLGILPFETDLHLFGLDVPRETEGIFLMGTDRLGRDTFSRVVFGARLSLSIGLIGVVFSFILGILLGGISGYFGGWIDNVIQRMIEFIRSLPDIPLWMSLSAALPGNWPIEKTFLAITIILSLIGWTGLARVIRGRFLSLREEDFVTAARVSGCSESRIIFQHMLPSFWSYIIANLTLSVPGMILGETGLSFIGLGLREPAISWGVLLQDAQQVTTLAVTPWLLWPAVIVIITVVAFNFMGDGLRDAADPYGH